jgi:hypothetical protein
MKQQKNNDRKLSNLEKERKMGKIQPCNESLNLNSILSHALKQSEDTDASNYFTEMKEKLNNKKLETKPDVKITKEKIIDLIKRFAKFYEQAKNPVSTTDNYIIEKSVFIKAINLLYSAVLNADKQNTNEKMCPFCSGKKASKDNNLKVSNPDLCKEWDYERNEKGPENYLSGSSEKVHWICTKGHRWEAIIANRTNGSGCPYCSAKNVGNKE